MRERDHADKGYAPMLLFFFFFKIFVALTTAINYFWQLSYKTELQWSKATTNCKFKTTIDIVSNDVYQVGLKDKNSESQGLERQFE